MKYLILLLLIPQLLWATEIEFSSGNAGDEEINTTTIDTGQVEVTSGSVGDREVSTTTIDLGSIEITTGTVGDEEVNVTTIKTGDDDNYLRTGTFPTCSVLGAGVERSGCGSPERRNIVATDQTPA